LTDLRCERGFGLPELLVATMLTSVLLLATFAILTGFGSAARRNFDQNRAQGVARTTIDAVTRELRNTGSPGTGTSAVVRATSWDLAFLTVNSQSAGSGSNAYSVQRVRYCLDSAARLWRQVQTWTTSSVPVVSSATACPHSSFGSQVLVSDEVVNQVGSSSRPLFSYDASAAADVRSVTIDLYVDGNTAKPPSAQRLTTAVFLRNQNRTPTAGFDATTTGNRHVLLNGSASADPDGDLLTYTWYDGTTVIGDGAVLDYTAPAIGSRSFSVKVADPGGASATSPVQTIDVQ
jgi:prepilin-type N-terminal cleavage/methylation domain-containing protein